MKYVLGALFGWLLLFFGVAISMLLGYLAICFVVWEYPSVDLNTVSFVSRLILIVTVIPGILGGIAFAEDF